MTVLQHAASVVAIDFAEWHREHGITALLFDIEGTITEWNDPGVEQQIIDHLALARASGIEHIGIVTNINAKHAARVEQVAASIAADTFRFPTSFFERKPSGRMIRSILHELSTSPQACGFIGDKLVDVLAARNAGVARVAWVERHGTADQWFDRSVYRRLEPLLRRRPPKT